MTFHALKVFSHYVNILSISIHACTTFSKERLSLLEVLFFSCKNPLFESYKEPFVI